MPPPGASAGTTYRAPIAFQTVVPSTFRTYNCASRAHQAAERYCDWSNMGVKCGEREVELWPGNRIRLGAFGCLLFGALGVLMLLTGGPSAIAIGGVIYFGVGGLFLLQRAVRPALRISCQGVTDLSTLRNLGTITWPDIAQISLTNDSSGSKALAIIAVDSGLLALGTVGALRRVTGAALTIPLSVNDLPADEVAQLAKRHWLAHAAMASAARGRGPVGMQSGGAGNSATDSVVLPANLRSKGRSDRVESEYSRPRDREILPDLSGHGEKRVCVVCASLIPQSAARCVSCGASLSLIPSRTARARTGDLAGILAVGTQLSSGKYSVGKLLGRGGFGITYLGADLRLRRPTAIKEFFLAGAVRHNGTVVPPPTLSRDDYARAQAGFTQEAQVLARFRHPSIVAVHEVFQENATTYMVMEYLSGVTLAGALEQRGRPLGESELLGIARSLTEALDLIHAAGLLHRDIKPENIMLVHGTVPLRPVLIDFGAAREFVSGKTVRQSVVLTPGYAPLEQYAEQAHRGPQTDVYALAATLYHVATAVQPPAVTDRINGVMLRAPRTLNPSLSGAFSQALLHAMQTRMADRPATAGQFFKELTGGSAPASKRVAA